MRTPDVLGRLGTSLCGTLDLFLFPLPLFGISIASPLSPYLSSLNALPCLVTTLLLILPCALLSALIAPDCPLITPSFSSCSLSTLSFPSCPLFHLCTKACRHATACFLCVSLMVALDSSLRWWCLVGTPTTLLSCGVSLVSCGDSGVWLHAKSYDLTKGSSI
jgi:hypothetical protein